MSRTSSRNASLSLTTVILGMTAPSVFGRTTAEHTPQARPSLLASERAALVPDGRAEHLLDRLDADRLEQCRHPDVLELLSHAIQSIHVRRAYHDGNVGQSSVVS